jgi:hypothetical protein
VEKPMSESVEAILQYEQSRGGAHQYGTLTGGPLDRIAWYLEVHFKDRPIRSVETGCGASTILFSKYCEHHTVYTYDDKAQENSSVNFVLESADFRSDKVKWIFGPTQRTIFSDPLDHDVDMILIDGPHGYPFPELEYFAFYKRLRPGGILIVDDIHIPTIYNLYKFLLQDDSFYSHGVAATTAFFQRSNSPAFDMESDGWKLQRYLVQGFPAVSHEDLSVGHALPIKLLFDGKFEGAPLTRGFSWQNGRPVTEGSFSVIDVKITSDAPRKVKLSFDIEPICVEDRLHHAPGFKLVVGGKQVQAFQFKPADDRGGGGNRRFGELTRRILARWNFQRQQLAGLEKIAVGLVRRPNVEFLALFGRRGRRQWSGNRRQHARPQGGLRFFRLRRPPL